jgi:hypothetical protein
MAGAGFAIELHRPFRAPSVIMGAPAFRRGFLILRSPVPACYRWLFRPRRNRNVVRPSPCIALSHDLHDYKYTRGNGQEGKGVNRWPTDASGGDGECRPPFEQP